MIFWYFFSLIEPIRAPDKHVKLVFLKIRFRGDIREICDFAQANTEWSQTLLRLTLRGVNQIV